MLTVKHGGGSVMVFHQWGLESWSELTGGWIKFKTGQTWMLLWDSPLLSTFKTNFVLYLYYFPEQISNEVKGNPSHFGNLSILQKSWGKDTQLVGETFEKLPCKTCKRKKYIHQILAHIETKHWKYALCIYAWKIFLKNMLNGYWMHRYVFFCFATDVWIIAKVFMQLYYFNWNWWELNTSWLWI